MSTLYKYFTTCPKNVQLNISVYVPIVYVLQGELLPADQCSVGCGLLGVIDNVSLFVSIKMVPTLTSTLGISGTFWLYSATCFSVVVVSLIFMPETKGKTLEEIESYYRGDTRVFEKSGRNVSES